MAWTNNVPVCTCPRMYWSRIEQGSFVRAFLATHNGKIHWKHGWPLSPAGGGSGGGKGTRKQCKELKLVIEVDRITHLDDETGEKDKQKSCALKSAGFTINQVYWRRCIEEYERCYTEDWKGGRRDRAVQSTPCTPASGGHDWFNTNKGLIVIP